MARGGRAGEVSDLAVWAVPFGLVGGRLYHVLTDHDLYFGEGKHPDRGALRLARAGSASGARSRSAPSASASAPGARGSGCCRSLDAMAPGVLVAQAIGRWGNWFNQELFGKPTDLPWGLEIARRATGRSATSQYDTFHPTFLYECLWYLGGVRRS